MCEYFPLAVHTKYRKKLTMYIEEKCHDNKSFYSIWSSLYVVFDNGTCFFWWKKCTMSKKQEENMEILKGLATKLICYVKKIE